MMKWVFTAVAIALSAFSGGAAPSLPSLLSALDPSCRAPTLELRGGGNSGRYLLRSSDQLNSLDAWETELDVYLDGSPFLWHESAGHQHGRRFFRLEKLSIIPPEAFADNFRLIDQNGNSHELAREGDAQAFATQRSIRQI